MKTSPSRAPFCDEPILAVYLGSPWDDEQEVLFLDCFFDMAVHLTKGYRLILETAHNYLFLQSDGVFKAEKTGDTETIRRENETIDPCTRYDYEYVLLTGERLLSAEPQKNGFVAHFDDFSLWIVPHETNETFKRLGPFWNCRVYGTERLIRRVCSCNGRGRLFLNERYDYFVECDKCRARTEACASALDAIGDWNAQKNLFVSQEHPETDFFAHMTEDISFIALPADAWFLDDNLAECRELIIALGGRVYWLCTRFNGFEDVTDPSSACQAFCFRELSEINPFLYPYRIVSTKEEPLRFIQKETDNIPYPVLMFKIGERPLRITAEKDLTVGLSGVDENGEFVFFENQKMINDRVDPRCKQES